MFWLALHHGVTCYREATMPVWYYEKKDLKNSPSTLSGLPYEDEIRYRREGAR